MWGHLIAALSLGLICVVWFAVQRISGRVDAGSCGCGHDASGRIGSRPEEIDSSLDARP